MSHKAGLAVVVEKPSDPEGDFVRCGATFQPSWQPTLWCSCDRPQGHTGDHFGAPRGGVWTDPQVRFIAEEDDGIEPHAAAAAEHLARRILSRGEG